jgi:tetratricopeptide (TPR) repeat protein
MSVIQSSRGSPHSTILNYIMKLQDMSWRPLVLAVFLLGLVIRLISLSQVVSTPVFLGLSMDSNLYDTLALQIVKGDWGYKDSVFLNEFYQFFLAGLYRIFGFSHMAVVLLQVLLDSLSCVLIYNIGSRAFGRSVGLVAALIYALYGIAVFYSGLVLDTTVTIFLQLLFLSLLISGSEKKDARLYYLVSGIVFGLLLMARPNLIVFMLALPLYGLFFLKKRIGAKASLVCLSLFTLTAGAVLSLSAARHFAHFAVLSPFPAHGGFNFYIGNNREAQGIFMSPSGVSSNPISQIKTSIRLASKQAGKELGPYEASSYWLARGMAFLAENPLDALKLYLRKTFLFLRNEEVSLNIDYTQSKELIPLFKIPFFTYGILSPLCLLGLFIALRRRDEKSVLLVLYYGACAASIILFFISDRYRLPSVPFAALFAALGLTTILRSIREKDLGKVSTLILPAAAAAFLFNYDFDAIAENRVTGTHHNNLAIVYMKLGDTKKAEEMLEKAIAMDPQLAASYNNLGQLYVEQGKAEPGMALLRKSLDLDPNYAVAYYNLGMALEKEGNTEQSRKHYERALDLSPNLVEARVNLANLLSSQGDLGKAESHFLAALEEDPDMPQALQGLGNLRAKKGDLPGAVSAFSEVLKQTPGDYSAQVNIALAYRKMGRIEEAVAWYEKAIQTDPARAEAYVQFGAALSARGDSGKAMAQYQKALDLDPRSYEACIKLGIELARQNNLEGAIEHFKRAVQIRPEGEEGHLNLAKAYLIKGDKASAMAQYRRMQELNPEAAKQLQQLLGSDG